MRVLIVTALFACAAAAPSGAFAPLFYQSVAIPAVVPTVSPGDIQAAAIDAQVKINDLARAAADQAQIIADQQQNLADQQQNLADQQQNLADQAANSNVKSVPDADLINEKNVEAFWANEDKKWQALDALKTAEAEVDGAVASNAAAYAKTAVGGVIPYASPVVPVVAAPISPLSPLVYSSYVGEVKSVATQSAEVKPDEKKEETQEAAVKTAEPEKQAVSESTEKTAAVEKSDDKPVGFVSSVVTPYSSVYRYNALTAPVSNYFGQPAVYNYAAVQPINTVLTPYLRTVW